MERLEKSRLVIESLVKGWHGGGKITVGPPPNDGEPFICYGQRWLVETVVPEALKSGRPFWQIDNGFWFPGRGSTKGYYRISYRGLSSVMMKDADRRRFITKQPTFRPWRKTGRHVLFAHPGLYYGRCVGLDMTTWINETRERLKAATSREIIEREKCCRRPLQRDLQGCWALVTHSSNVAIDALAAGIPVFVAPTSPAAPVGNLSLEDLENPQMPYLDAWWSSLRCQQFTVAEMANGTAYRLLDRVRQQVDGEAVA